MENDYKGRLGKIVKIDREINYLRAARKEEVAKYIEKLICEFDIDLRDIEKHVATSCKRKKASPKYFDPISGATWSGRGKRPRWLIDRDPNDFLLDNTQID